MEISFVVDIIPIPKGRPRLGRGVTFTPPKTREYESHLKSLFKKEMMEKTFGALDVPLKVYLEFVLVRPKKPRFIKWPGVRSDIDNYIKAFLDAGNDILWTDDSLICDIRAIKVYGNKPGIIVKIEEL